ncbi:hypothetical protein SKAU_G00224150 [Synaphobranchus kaupii]|uniref:Regulation of nuclear pre-mRNA domain-containing protein 2 n=1 Tax=Synaphobranchus kaupii TaxID=118154 RepID=A0A9Q1FBA4_SYNKA|nr:hypothetical protein SKAU_G00224150 [Synaphobranchus kaupii]
MAAGATSGHGGRGSSATLESSLDRRFQGVSNTMESIQGLSTWCIENKKYHSLIVRYWMKWLRKSEAAHRLNLFYLANDVIQNCKRKNAIIYRNSFAEVLPEAALLVKDGKVRKSVERIFTIWEERNVYPEELISELKASLVKKEPPPGRSSRSNPALLRGTAVCQTKKHQAPVNPKAALKSKIVAEFAPQTFIEQLSTYKKSMEEAELKEKQLSALRVDVCSTEGLKRLKDKAGGKKFSKDFEEGSGKLQEFVGFLEQQMKGGPPLLEALGNADVFYEMQYKEVKIVANAYKTFANRVSNLKRKLDALKASLPDPDDSPIPSPSEDAPSPTGSESPFHGMGVGGAKGEGLTDVANMMDMDIDGKAMDDGDEAGISLGDVPSPLSSPGGSHGQAHGEGDNRDVEDMELSEGEETESTSIIEERREKPATIAVSKPTPAPVPVPPVPVPVPVPAAAAAPAAATAAAPAVAVVPPPLCTSEEPPAKQTPPPATPAATPTPIPTPTHTTPGTPATPLPVNLANVDLGKISSILSSLTSVMKSTGVSPVSRPSPGTPTTPSAHGSVLKPPTQSPGAPQAANPLASILSRVDITPEGILSALSKTQGQSPGLQGLSSLLHSVAGNASSGASKERTPSSSAAAPPQGHSYSAPEATPSASATAGAKTSATPTTPKQKLPLGNSYKRELDRDRERGREQEKERDFVAPVSASPSSLESKIHKFLQGNPGFSGLNLSIPILGGTQGGSNDSPLLGSENVDGTPVRDETGGTPTQDEMMDKPGSESLALLADSGPLGGAKKLPSSAGHDLSPTAYRSDAWDAAISPQTLFGKVEERDGDYRPARYSAFGADKKPDKKPAKSALKSKGEDAAKRKMAGSVSSSLSSSSSAHQDAKPGHVKARKEGHGGVNNLGKLGERRASAGSEPHPHHSLSVSERLKSAGARKAGGGPDEGSKEREGEGDGGKEKASGSTSPVHRIETLVSSSSCGEGAPIETLGYSNRRMSGERIQTVESIRVIGRGMRPHPRGGGAVPRPGPTGDSWYDEAYMEGPPPPTLGPPPSLGLPPHPSNPSLSSQGGPDERGPSALPPPPTHLLPPHPHLPPGQFQFEERPHMPYPGDDPHSRPHPHPHPHPHQRPPPSSFFSSPPPPIPQPPPPPIPQPPPPPRDFLSPPSAVMVGGVLVPVDRVLPFPPPRPDGGERGGVAGGGGSGGSANPAPHCPPPLMSSLLGEPPQFKELPRPGTVKEHFAPRHAPPLHRPGTPGPPPPLLGRTPPPPAAPRPPPSETVPPRGDRPTPCAPPSLTETLPSTGARGLAHRSLEPQGEG